MHRESGDDDGDDDESVRERWDDSHRDSSSTGWRSSMPRLWRIGNRRAVGSRGHGAETEC